MRIVSGLYKGRKLLGYDLEGTRPTMERVKESLFAMLQDKIKESICLDLFAGSGNLGLEALSQGASKVVFADHNKKAIQTIKNNCKTLQIKDQVAFYKGDFRKVLEQLEGHKFNLIFLDPPYQTNYIEEAIKLITDYQLLSNDGYLILESDQKKKVLAPSFYELLKLKCYGDKYISIIKNLRA